MKMRVQEETHEMAFSTENQSFDFEETRLEEGLISQESLSGDNIQQASIFSHSSDKTTKSSSSSTTSSRPR